MVRGLGPRDENVLSTCVRSPIRPCNVNLHPKTLRMGQRLQSRFGKSGAARKLGLVQIIEEASSIRGGFRKTEPCQLVSGWCCRCVLRDCRECLSIQTAGRKLCILETMTCSLHSRNYSTPFSHFFRTANVAMTSPRYELGKVAFSSMFPKRKKSQRFGPYLFPSFTTQANKSLCHS